MINQTKLEMKKIFSLFAVLMCISLTLAGCKKEIPTESITLKQNSIVLYAGQTAQLEATVTPADATGSVAWYSLDPEVVTVQNGKVSMVSGGTTTVVAISGDKIAYCEVLVDATTVVDLGLSVKWADRNVGMDYPDSRIEYYAWGETETKEEFTLDNYKWYVDKEFTKYNTREGWGIVDNNLVMDIEDDVAHVRVGGKWRMPTKENFEELLENCVWEFAEVGGKNGCKVTGKTGNSIFFPFDGGQDGNVPTGVDNTGYYWTTDLNSETPSCAVSVVIRSSTRKFYEKAPRNYGLSVRPVCD